MAQPFIGEIRAFSFAFAPQGWVTCAGQLLPINQNQALFSLLGTTYGGNGQTTFGLPDLRGRVALGMGTDPNGNPYVIGQISGEEQHTLTIPEMPQHSHTVGAAVSTAGATNVPGATVILGSSTSNAAGNPPLSIYDTSGTNPIALAALGTAGSSQAHENRMPSLAMSYCIAIVGIFPSRN